MKKALKWISILICLLVILLAAAVTLFGGAILKGSINRFGPALTGVPVTLEQASFKPFSGKIKLTNLHVGNPNGFKMPALLDLHEMEIEINVKSLLSDTIVIHKIAMVSPHITYERSLLGSNIDELQKHLQAGARKPGEKASEPKAQKGGRKVIIDELLVTDPELDVSIVAAGGYSIPMKLGRVELRDIGRKQGGVTFADAIAIIASVITSNVDNAAAGAGNLLGSGAQAIGNGAQTVGGAAVHGASSVIKGVGKFFGSSKPPQTNSNSMK